MNQPATQPESSSQAACPSCGDAFVGRYCSQCGEKRLTEDDKRLRSLLGELLSAFMLVDGKLWRTLRALVFDPGRLSRDHADGRRRIYMKPLGLFLLANVFYFLLPMMNTFYSTLQLQVGGGFVHSEVARDWVEAEIERRGVAAEQYAEAFDRKTKSLSKLLLICLAMLFSVPYWLLHGVRSSYFSETAVLSLEMMSFVILIFVQAFGTLFWILAKLGLTTGISWTVGELFLSLVGLGLVFYFLLRAERTFYRAQGRAAWLRAIGGALVFVVVLYIYRALLFFVTYWLV